MLFHIDLNRKVILYRLEPLVFLHISCSVWVLFSTSLLTTNLNQTKSWVTPFWIQALHQFLFLLISDMINALWVGSYRNLMYPCINLGTSFNAVRIISVVTVGWLNMLAMTSRVRAFSISISLMGYAIPNTFIFVFSLNHISIR